MSIHFTLAAMGLWLHHELLVALCDNTCDPSTISLVPLTATWESSKCWQTRLKGALLLRLLIRMHEYLFYMGIK